MVETVVEKSVPKSQKVTTKAKKSDHPATSQMVTAAIRQLNEKKGSSLQAIKKYIGMNYQCDEKKIAPFIRKYVTNAAKDGKLVQTKGHGASGSFKLPENEKLTRSPRNKNVLSKRKVAKKSRKTTVKTTKALKVKKVVIVEPKRNLTPKKKLIAKSKKAGVSPRAPKPKTIKAKKSTPSKKK